MLMSDTTFHLEESLTGLSKINSIEGQKANIDAWNALPAPERDDLVQTLRQTENSTPFHTIMGLDHIELMRDLTATTREPFVTGEIVDRLAATLDENLATLVGPKMSELKVADPDRFKFKPKKLLAALAQVYLNLAPEGDFIRAVANDGRSYSKELFERFARTLKNRAIMTDAEVAGVVAFAQKVEDMRATIMIEDEREIPDEFLDPLMSTRELLPIRRRELTDFSSHEGPRDPTRFAGRHRQSYYTYCSFVKGARPVQQRTVSSSPSAGFSQADPIVSSTRSSSRTQNSRPRLTPGWLRARLVLLRV